MQEIMIDVDPMVDLTNEHCSVCQCRLTADLVEPITLQPGHSRTCIPCFIWVQDTAKIVFASAMQKSKNAI
jgi:hypothetical protein